MDADYVEFCDSFLVAVADAVEPPGVPYFDVKKFCEEHRIQAQESWLLLVAGDLAKQGYGQELASLTSRSFKINGAGLRRATEIRDARRPKSIGQKIDSVNWAKWASIATIVAAVIAIIALF